ncbi:contactin-4-like [Macrobrachium rosenbergii]|uniref:contactin-4-like n=1 Tax=Macrobrachium rosenbergii TaxID=79674 RepID=UPI0034D49359
MILRDLFVLLHLFKGVYGSIFDHIPDDVVTRYVDVKDDVTLPCDHGSNISVVWLSEGPHDNFGRYVHTDGSLYLPNVTRQMTGYYICRQESEERLLSSYNLIVRGPPDPPQNVTVHALTVIAIVKWHLHLDDDWEDSLEGPKTTLQLRYRRLPSSQWLHLPHHIAPNQNQVDIYHLQPNSTYEFQLWTKNSYGVSDIVSVNGTTLHDVAEIELARMLEENMEGFSPQVWIVAVVIVMGVITVSGLYLLVDHCQQHRFGKSDADCSEGIELVPNIIENPGYQNSHGDPNNHLEAAIHESLLMSPTASCSRTALV